MLPAYVPILSQLPHDLHCFIGGKDKTNLSDSISVLLQAQSKDQVTLDDDSVNNCIAVLLSLCATLMFRYTSTSSIKMKIQYKEKVNSWSPANLEITLITSPDQKFMSLLQEVQKQLESSVPNIDVLSLQNIYYIHIHDVENESPEIVAMSKSGGLFLQFINIEDCFLTIFSFENLLDTIYPMTIDISSHWRCLLNSIMAYPRNFALQNISQINILEKEERNTLINVWGKCEHLDLPESYNIKQPLLHKLFERQAKLHPDNTAIKFEAGINSKAYSYREANSLANDIAQYISTRIQTSKRDVKIGHFFPRCADAYVAMLGVLKSGSAYVPLDPAYPMDRLTYILSDCEASIVVTTAELGKKLKEYLKTGVTQNEAHPLEVVIWDDMLEEIELHYKQPAIEFDDRHTISTTCSSQDPCYVIYTSGTTGKPKGCIIEHQSAVNFVLSESVFIKMTDKDIIFQTYSLAFDSSISTIWLAFFNGATLYVPTEDMMHSGNELAQYINKANITVLDCVPSLLTMMTIGLSEEEMQISSAFLPSVKVIIVGGEPCSRDIIRKWTLNGKRRMINSYGPTEATVSATFADCRIEDEIVTVGTVQPNYEVYILDSYMQPVPAGVPARGYLNRDDLTKAKFIPNPFAASSEQSQRLYKTGDLARYIPLPVTKGVNAMYPEGSIELLGRIDLQVKVRGFRVEIPEIESAIVGTCDQIQFAVINLWKNQNLSSADENVEILVAYILLKDKATFDRESVKYKLSQFLPEYMIPSVYQVVKDIPFLPSGKVDRKALPDPELTTDNDYINDKNPDVDSQVTAISSELNPTQTQLAHLWSKLLHSGKEPIGLESDFFELGGHSMVAAKLVSSLRTMPVYCNVTVLDIYKNSSLELFSRRLETLAQSNRTNCSNDHEVKDDQKDVPSIPKAEAFISSIIRWLSTAIGLYLVFFYASLSPILTNLISNYLEDNGPASNDTPTTYQVFYFTLISLAITVLVYPLICIAAKWIILGRMKPGVYPLYGQYYWRWWVIHRMITMLPLALFRGSPVLVWFYQALGAKIGKGVYIGTGFVSCLDMLTVGNNTSIGIDARITGYTVKVGKPKTKGGRCTSWLIVGSINIGSDCYIGASTHLSLNTVIPKEVRIAEFSMVPELTVLDSGKSYVGSPVSPCQSQLLDCDFAKQAQTSFSVSESHIDPKRLPHRLVNVMHVLLLVLMLLVYGVASLPGAFAMLIITSQITFDSQLPIQFDSDSKFTALHIVWIMAIMLLSAIASTSFHVISADLVSPHVEFRILGAKIGRSCEIGMTFYSTPDRFIMEDGSFISDGVYLSPPRIHEGWVKISDTIIGEKSFIGNSSLLPSGVEIKNNSLLGVLSRTPLPSIDAPKEENEKVCTDLVSDITPKSSLSSFIDQVMPSEASWLGSPGINLPKRKLAATGGSASLTFDPPWYLYPIRLAFEVWKVCLPSVVFSMASLVLYYGIAYYRSLNWGNPLIFCVLFPFGYISVAVGCCLLVALLKYAIIGRYIPMNSPLWSFFLWKSEIVATLDLFLAGPILIRHIRGTPFLSWWLTLLGAKIGRNVWIEAAIIPEPELVTIGDDSVIGENSILQTHSFEDRVMKMSRLKIGKGCKIGAGSVALCDGVLEDYSELGDLSLLMNGETIVEYSKMHGTPAQSVKAS
ncbi:hypothetical protein INT43_007580 [Umbelopsis isabellina]|uniref:Carrier domain-containing protein n=1 Tax=Mortierella isabellina TaxID=91625 RepID=A0A8H7PPI9_MORIS|nr:hypothetical protein INT43_007580 [Umbelopsis isabellina]